MPGSLPSRRKLAFGLALAGAALLIFALARLGVYLSPGPDAVIHTFWPASGAGVGLLVRFGPRLWPAVWLGILASNLVSGTPLLFTLLGPAGNTLEALAGWWLFSKGKKFSPDFSRSAEVFRFIWSCVLVAPLVSAVVGMGSLAASGVPLESITLQFGRWWTAHAIGILVVAPIVGTAGRTYTRSRHASWVPVIWGLLISASFLALFVDLSPSGSTAPFSFIPFCLLAWLAFIGNPYQAACGALFLGGGTTVATTLQIGPFVVPDLLEQLTLLAGYNAAVCSISLVLGAMAEELRESENTQRTSLAAEAEFHFLRSQMHPHFLFNALTAVRRLIRASPDRAVAFVSDLADYLRASMNAANAPTIPLKAEFNTVEGYLKVEKVRLGERLAYTLNLPRELETCPLPPLVVQILVENAIKHGVSRITAGGSIHIGARRDGLNCCITVRNDTPPHGASSAAGPSLGLGLNLVRDRLKIGCGKGATLSAQKLTDNTFLSEITIPL